jgi:hypothetical protein
MLLPFLVIACISHRDRWWERARRNPHGFSIEALEMLSPGGGGNFSHRQTPISHDSPLSCILGKPYSNSTGVERCHGASVGGHSSSRSKRSEDALVLLGSVETKRWQRTCGLSSETDNARTLRYKHPVQMKGQRISPLGFSGAVTDLCRSARLTVEI